MNELLLNLAATRQAGRVRGIYSVCSAHPLVIEAAMRQAIADESPLLVEATSNQVDQFGGYTSMRPSDFRDFVFGIAQRVGFSEDKILLGGDHLGPNPWRDRPAQEAMQLAEELLATYAAAGFSKLHLDASMACAGDPPQLDDALVAERAARLCAAAEAAAPGGHLVYVIGTEVPVPGGAAEALANVEVTSPQGARRTLKVHQQAFAAVGLDSVWPRVIALVVQPGVEFDHTHVVDYAPAAAHALSGVLGGQSQFVFEAHSTDYQRPEALAQLVRDGYAILKVGPGLTFALREALYALSAIEAVLVPLEQRAHLPSVVERIMVEQPQQWQRYYHGGVDTQAQLRIFSYSDRMRYYWTHPAIQSAVDKLFRNLEKVEISENILSQFMPEQYKAVRLKSLLPRPKELVMEHIQCAIRPYVVACQQHP
ncbi:D-tagatose-bisphosphate aldolase, class II, non-catalytic subunit [Rhodoferax sp.]|uniref:D-tagatose-bisphosphate aldolase, class II, non-catalytic subunit n=1 Tax=Rhodoferax sp. TaxID=50421 RepID=UPI00374DA521